MQRRITKLMLLGGLLSLALFANTGCNGCSNVICGYGISPFCGSVGSKCKKDSDCDEGLYCDSGFRGRMCTKACKHLGTDRDCPSGSYCGQTAQAAEGTACFQSCLSGYLCRNEYRCKAGKGIGIPEHDVCH
jgi:hypothetical protein